MRKLFSFISVLCVAFALNATAQTKHAFSVINGSYVILTNNTTTSYNDTNVYYIDNNYTLRLSNSTNSIVPVCYDAGGVRVIPPGVFGGTNYFTNAITGGSVVCGPAWLDVIACSDRNGKVSDNVSIEVVSCGASSTNTGTLTFTFVGLAPTGPPYPSFLSLPNSPYPIGNLYTPMGQGIAAQLTQMETPSQNQFAFQVTENGTTPVILRTNVPTSFLQGCTAVRLWKVVKSSVASSGQTFLGPVSIQEDVP